MILVVADNLGHRKHCAYSSEIAWHALSGSHMIACNLLNTNPA